MYGLDLFSGIGGITKALEGYVTPVAYCENDRYAQGVLLSRMSRRDLPIAPIWDDVSTLHGNMLPPVDLIYGGFPCQDISIAGRGEGLAGKQSGLFFEIARLVGEIRPRFVFLENVPAINRRGANTVVGTLADLGYDCRWDVLSAADVGANHRRDRWWLLAYASGNGRIGGRGGPASPGSPRPERQEVPTEGMGEGVPDPESLGVQGRLCEQGRDSEPGTDGEIRIVADATGGKDIEREPGDMEQAKKSGEGCDASSRDGGQVVAHSISQPIKKTPKRRTQRQEQDPFGADWWSTEPNVGRVAHGIPLRLDRLRTLGNAVVPAQAREAFERLMGLK